MAVGEALVSRLEEIEGAALELLALSPSPRRAVVDEVMFRAGVNQETAETAVSRLLQAGRVELFRTPDGGEELRLTLEGSAAG